MDDRHEPSLYLQTQELTSALLVNQVFEPEGKLESITCDGTCHDFYMMIFSAQRAWNRPKYTHTFATFVKARSAATDETRTERGLALNPCSPRGSPLETHTISWLAANKKVCSFRLWPEQGFNFDLAASLEWALSVQSRISMWGPFEIKSALYAQACRY